MAALPPTKLHALLGIQLTTKIETMNSGAIRILVSVLVALTLAAPAFAKDGDNGSGGGNSGSGSSGSGSSGSDDSGGDDSGGDDSGGDDSGGSGSGGDDSGGDDSGGNSGSGGNKGPGSGKRDQDVVRDAVKSGKAATLADLMAHLRKNYPGKILNVDLQRRDSKFVYRVKLLTKSGRLQTLKLNAKTLQRVWF
jgi:hypothetical protein